TSSDGITWVATYTANDGFDGTGSVTVTGPYTDLVANAGATGATDSVTIDREEAVAVANIKFVPNTSDFPDNNLPAAGQQIGTFVGYDAAGNIIPGATFTVTAGSSGTLSVASNGVVTGGLNNNDVFDFSVPSGGLTETVH